jgi:alpha-beta hydrolase superfamily lysophospholipase
MVALRLRGAVWAAWVVGIGCATPVAAPRPPQITVETLAAPAASEPAPAPIPLTARAHEVVVDAHPIAVWEKSPPDPRGVFVLVHGRTWSGRPDFDLQVPGESRSLMDMLVAEGFSTYAVDLRGYGNTPRDDTGWLTPDRAEADVAAVVDWVRAQQPAHERVVLLGWSLGALVSQLVAQRHGDELAAVVLYGYPRDPDQTYPDDTKTAIAPARTPTTAEAAAEDFIVEGAISPPGVQAFVDAALQADPVRMDWRGTAQFNGLDPAAVHVPTLLIHGERDPYAPVANQAKLFTRLGTPDRAWVIVPQGDHAAHMENCAPRFVDAVVSFVSRP